MITSIAMLAPSMIILLVFVIFPVLVVIALSLTRWELRSAAQSFVGWENYRDILSSPDFWRVLRNTIYFTAVKVPLDIVLSLGVALLLNRPLRGLALYRVAYFTPVVTSAVAVSAIWIWIYNPTFGLANAALKALGLPPQTWLSDPNLAMPAVILMSLWKGLGYDIVIFLAGLQNIPSIYHEAAQIDGANAWQRFRYITWPLLSPVTYFVLVIGIINSFKVFTQIHVMTPTGGPLGSTEVLVFYIYQQAFQSFKFGRAAAVAFVLFVIVAAITALQRHIIEPRVHYE
jgi:ABC-type sugar transport system permease subunit